MPSGTLEYRARRENRGWTWVSRRNFQQCMNEARRESVVMVRDTVCTD